MRIGRLNKRVTFQQPAAARDAYNQPSGAWTDVATCWASIEPLSAKESFLAGAAQSAVTHKITIRYRAGLTAAMRAVYLGRYFSIQALIDRGERHRLLEVLATEGPNNG